LDQIAPDKKSIANYYNADLPIFEKYGVDR